MSQDDETPGATESGRRPAVAARGEPNGESAPAKILAAAARRVRDAGLVRLSMQDVATEAGVSKALIHYHFRDRDALLARLIEWLTERLLTRERAALDGCKPAEAIDAVWRWIADELALEELRVLLELLHDPSPGAASAARRAARLRHLEAEATATRLFALLDLRPRVPVELLSGVVVAVLDGLALEATLNPERESRVSFDVFWLALLSLAE
ncbi:MAG: TetR/AcrR family transcriptional regulator [Gemmatimonadaceae bacterium]|nr:TetR/AcrR family transcriptional regulator [Gemmatimonadaceae bacterium]NUQ92248.1 TetR/AcrR family transcriptional regulator [Gemmatimonadaceae bacterium]NUR19498.1 TetR/AcrR family transcriptional regulator [Gemmatimonadaceae bacterium]NUS96530.1 TetR/AcrR family transcriptional regulator [Gemmatimonadaceae bacterium]